MGSLEKVSYKETLPVKYYEFARINLGETKEIREKCLQEIIDWLDVNPNINANREEVSLLHFLRGAKFRVDKAKQRIET